MFFSAAVSMEDHCVLFGTWGKPGVYKILVSLKNSGVRRVYWRTLGAGQAPYPSKVTEPLTHWAADSRVTVHQLIDPATAKVLVGPNGAPGPLRVIACRSIAGRRGFSFEITNQEDL